MLEIKNLSIEIDGKTIIQNLTFSVHENDKIAIIGEEGNGKSTLLKTIMGMSEYAKITGSIQPKNHTLGYLEQSISKENIEKSVLSYLYNDEIDYQKQKKLYALLKTVQLSESVLKRETMEDLSGGEKVKIQLVKLLLEEPDILLLDEPTNDLDMETLVWLEDFIKYETRPILYVSHDETLLSKTANAILHLELQQHKMIPKSTFLKIGYQEYVEKRLASIQKTTQVARKEQYNFSKQQDKLRQIMNKVEYQQKTITRADPHGAKMLKRKMKSIKAQEKRMDNQTLTEIPSVEESIYFFFEESQIPASKTILNIKLQSLLIGNKELAQNINLEIIGNQRIGIIGKNGVGKTTFIRKIWEELKSRNDIKVGYMPQRYEDIMNFQESPIQFLCETDNPEEIALMRSFMGNMNFTREEMVEPIEYLSGGSRAKLILLKLVKEKCNVLILDEPTRNVSPLSNPVIRASLQQFWGTIISVSHDRKYLSEVCDQLYELTSKGLFPISKEKALM